MIVGCGHLFCLPLDSVGRGRFFALVQCVLAKIDAGDVALTFFSQGRMKDTRKHRRQQGEKEREAEIARAEAADLAAQLRKVLLADFFLLYPYLGCFCGDCLTQKTKKLVMGLNQAKMLLLSIKEGVRESAVRLLTGLRRVRLILLVHRPYEQHNIFPCFLRNTQASREVKRIQLEAAELREEKARVENESKDLTRENRTLQDRLNDGSLRSRTRERDR